MPPVVIPGVCRFSYEGTLLGHRWANVLHFDINTDIGDARDDAIRDQAKVLNNNWNQRISQLVSTQCQLERTSFVDLDSLDGITGDSVQVDLPNVMPRSGGQAADPEPGGVALLIKKQTGGGRSQRPGRMYQCGLVDTSISGNTIDAAFLSTCQTQFEAWLDACNQESTGLPGGATYSSVLVVPHVAPGAPQGTFAQVTGLIVDSIAATQRRRQR